MAKLDGLEAVLEFIKGLQPKITAQIAKNLPHLPPRSPVHGDEAAGHQELCHDRDR